MASAEDPPATPASQETRPGILSRPKADIAPQGGAKDDSATDLGQTQAVRFSSVNQEIEPLYSLRTETITRTSDEARIPQEISPENQELLKKLSQSLQRHRTSNFTFEPVSLPTSRDADTPVQVPSPQAQSRPTSRTGSPLARPPATDIHSPPLTPTEAQSRNVKLDPRAAAVYLDPTTMTPEISPPQGALVSAPVGDETAKTIKQPQSASSSQPSTPSDPISSRSTLVSKTPDETTSHASHRASFTVGPPTSSESEGPSPEVTREPRPNFTGPSTSFARPFAPGGERDDPYARSKRPLQHHGTDNIDPRFVFGGKDSRRPYGQSSPNLAAVGLPRSSSGGGEVKPHSEKRHSSLFKKDHHRGPEDSTGTISGKHGSMSDLKRFFGLTHKGKRSHSPVPPHKSNKSGYRTPPSQPSQSILPFADDHGLSTRYGKFGKVLGSGAGGSVRLMKRSSDGVTFAVKEFRPRHAHESERDYAKKVTAEFCIGSTLHHGNIIETLDIVQEKGRWYEVMEFAPYDLFAIVMTGKMSREEVTCTFLQIFASVTYLHSMGLAHRDLKLDNVVVNEHGIMKLIDFGSASVFRYPFEDDIVLVQGIVGSDPYLAPEVYDNNKYDPQPADIWSLAIIYCCMSLRRFPWKVPRLSDNSFKHFASPPPLGESDPEQSTRGVYERHKSTSDLPNAVKEKESAPIPGSPPPSREPSAASSAAEHHHHHHHSHHHHEKEQSETSPRDEATTSTPQNAVIKGPWRLLRLLPRDSRHIIGRMLEITPKYRATLDEMLADPWINSSPVCRQEEGGRVVSAPGHTHTLEPGTGVTAEPAKQ